MAGLRLGGAGADGAGADAADDEPGQRVRAADGTGRARERGAAGAGQRDREPPQRAALQPARAAGPAGADAAARGGAGEGLGAQQHRELRALSRRAGRDRG
eukprot:510198-Rhodomonas_salina.1